jgi:hypothetical protein
MNRLLLLSYCFPPDNAAAAMRPGQLFRYLPECGYQPAVICSSLSIPDTQSFVERVPGERVPAAVRFASKLAATFERIAVPYNDRLPWVPHAIAAASRLIEREKIEAIYSTSPFLAGQVAALWLNRKYGLPWIADFQDPVIENPQRGRPWPYPYDSFLERAVFANASLLMANTDTVAASWATRYPQWARKIGVLWNSYDPLEKIPPPTQTRRSYRLLSHIGSLYGDRTPYQLLGALSRLVKDRSLDPSTLRVNLVGKIWFPEEEISHFGLQENGMLECQAVRVPRIEALRMTVDSDYLLVIDQPTTTFQVPSKILDYVRIGKPILAFTLPESPLERILRQSGIAYVAISPQLAEAATCAKVMEFLSLPPEPRTPNPWFEENFNCVHQARTVARGFDELRGVASRAPV